MKKIGRERETKGETVHKNISRSRSQIHSTEVGYFRVRNETMNQKTSKTLLLKSLEGESSSIK